MQFAPRRKRQTPPVIIVALIDILIVLLIFMMVTTTFKKKQPAVKLALPESSQATPGASETETLLVTVDKKEPYFYVDDLAVTYGQLQSELINRAQASPKLELSIRADEIAPIREIVKVMDAAKSAGLKVASLQTRAIPSE